MRIAVISDLHLDMRENPIKEMQGLLKPSEECEALFVAGDISEHTSYGIDLKFDFFELVSKRYPKVFLTTGNHDYWRAKGIQEDVDEDLYVMSNKFNNINYWPVPNVEKSLGQYNVNGGTLWYEAVDRDWCDFRNTRHLEGYIKEQAPGWDDYLKTEMNEKSIVLSHMLPSEHCIGEQYQGWPTNRFFVHDKTKYILEKKPKLWIFGHTHSPFDFMLGDTRMYCNPLAYKFEMTNPDFADRIEIDI